MADTYAVLQSLLGIARPVILRHYRADSCIASSRIAIDVLSHFGILAEPLTVNLTVYNPAFAARIEAGDREPETQDELNEWIRKYGAWNVGVGMGGDPRLLTWGGHLVVIAEKRCILDLSADQANRPQRNINLVPLGGDVPPEFFDGEPLFFQINGCVLKYLVSPDNNGYTSSPDWLQASRREPLVQEIIKKMKEEKKW
jgi:hypothetical protein